MSADLKKANITIRNFPATVAELRKRIKLSEGGDTYLFAKDIKQRTESPDPLRENQVDISHAVI